MSRIYLNIQQWMCELFWYISKSLLFSNNASNTCTTLTIEYTSLYCKKVVKWFKDNKTNLIKHPTISTNTNPIGSI